MRRLNTEWPNRGVNIWNDSEWWAGKPWEDHPMIWGGNLWPPWHPSFLGFGANQPLYGQTDKFFKIGLGEYSGCYDAYRTSGNGHRIGLFAVCSRRVLPRPVDDGLRERGFLRRAVQGHHNGPVRSTVRIRLRRGRR